MQRYSYDTIPASSEMIVGIKALNSFSSQTIFSGVRASFLSGFCEANTERIYRPKKTASREAL
jgi:hypothetical protein